MRLRLPSHATVVAYLALAVALGGTAYAALRVDSRDVVNDSIRSKDLADGKAVAGKDVRQNALSGEHIRENRLDAGRFSAFAEGGGSCNQVGALPAVCGEAVIRLPATSHVLALATGAFSSGPDPEAGRANCSLTVDGRPESSTAVGQTGTAHADPSAADGFAVTAVSGPLAVGEHRVDLRCEGVGSARITDASVSVFGIGSFR